MQKLNMRIITLKKKRNLQLEMRRLKRTDHSCVLTSLLYYSLSVIFVISDFGNDMVPVHFFAKTMKFVKV